MERVTGGGQNYSILVVMAVLGIVPLFDNGFAHPVMYGAYGLVGLWTLGTGLFSRQVPKRIASLPLLWLGLALFVLVSGISIFWAANHQEAVAHILELLLGTLLFYLIVSKFEKNEVYKMVSFLLILGSALALYGIVSYLLLASVRIRATFVNPNPFGIYMVMLGLLALSLYLFQHGKTWHRAIPAVLMLEAMVLTGSRASWAAFFLALPFLLSARLPAMGWSVLATRLVTLFLVVVLLTLVMTMAAPFLQDQVRETQTGQQLLNRSLERIESQMIRAGTFLDSSVDGRLSFWKVAGKMIAARPLTGVGLGNYRNLYMLFWNEDRFYSRFAHNHYLQVAAETGLFGLCGLLIFLGAFYYYAVNGIGEVQLQNKSTYLGLLAGCSAFLLHGAVDFSWNMPAVALAFWLMAGMIMVLRPFPANSGGNSAGSGMRWAVIVLSFVLLVGGSTQYLGYYYAQQAERVEEKGEYLLASGELEKAIRFNPIHPRYFSRLSYNYAMLYAETGAQVYRDKALETAERAVELSPYSYIYRVRLARLQSGLTGEEQRARENLELAVRYAGFYLMPYVELGYFYLHQGNLEGAEQVFRRGLQYQQFALANAPNATKKQEAKEQVARLYQGMAEICRRRGLPEELLAAVRESLQIDSENRLARGYNKTCQ